MEVVAQSNSCSVCVYTYRGKGEARMLCKYCFNILNKLRCGEFSNSCEPEEKSNWLREQTTDSFQRPSLSIEIFDTSENYFLGKRDFFCFKWGHLAIQWEWNTQELKTQVGVFDFWGAFCVLVKCFVLFGFGGGCCLFWRGFVVWFFVCLGFGFCIFNGISAALEIFIPYLLEDPWHINS